ncbi:MAG: hypothetical protein V7785_20325 [Bermanella sp.]
MNTVQQGEFPDDALLAKYHLQGAKTDCYFIDLPKQVSQAQYIEAFYTTKLFKVERFILALIARRPSTDEQAKHLALAKTKQFAAWSVEQQTQDQLLLCDFMGKTRSWLKSVSHENGNGTRLYFGSAVIPKKDSSNTKPKFGLAFNALGGFHHVYSKALLKAAGLRLLG